MSQQTSKSQISILFFGDDVLESMLLEAEVGSTAQADASPKRSACRSGQLQRLAVETIDGLLEDLLCPSRDGRNAIMFALPTAIQVPAVVLGCSRRQLKS